MEDESSSYSMKSFIWNVQTEKSTDGRPVPGKGEEAMEVIPRQDEVSIGDNNNILELDSGDIDIIFEYMSNHCNVHFKKMNVIVFQCKLLGEKSPRIYN